MKRSFFIRFCTIAFTSVLLLLSSCKNSVSKESFIGLYRLQKAVPVNANLSSPANWFISLEEKNNFSLSNKTDTIYGYWKVEDSIGETQLLLNSSGVTTLAKFNGKQILFGDGTKLLNTTFSEAVFVKQ